MDCATKTEQTSSRETSPNEECHPCGGRWTDDETRQLVKLVDTYGTNWTKIAELFEGRTGKQCRERYHNHGREGLVKEQAWTPQEEWMLISQHKEHGNSWTQIAECLGGRSESSTKNKWYSTKRAKQVSEPPTLLQQYIINLASMKKETAYRSLVPTARAMGLLNPSSGEEDDSGDSDSSAEVLKYRGTRSRPMRLSRRSRTPPPRPPRPNVRRKLLMVPSSQSPSHTELPPSGAASTSEQQDIAPRPTWEPLTALPPCHSPPANLPLLPDRPSQDAHDTWASVCMRPRAMGMSPPSEIITPQQDGTYAGAAHLVRERFKRRATFPGSSDDRVGPSELGLSNIGRCSSWPAEGVIGPPESTSGSPRMGASVRHPAACSQGPQTSGDPFCQGPRPSGDPFCQGPRPSGGLYHQEPQRVGDQNRQGPSPSYLSPTCQRLSPGTHRISLGSATTSSSPREPLTYTVADGSRGGAVIPGSSPGSHPAWGPPSPAWGPPQCHVQAFPRKSEAKLESPPYSGYRYAAAATPTLTYSPAPLPLPVPPQESFVGTRGSPTESKALNEPSVPLLVSGIMPPPQSLLTPLPLNPPPRGNILPSPPELFLPRVEEGAFLPGAHFPVQTCSSPLGLAPFLLEPLGEGLPHCKPLDMSQHVPLRQVSWLQGINIHTPNVQRAMEEGDRLPWTEIHDGVDTWPDRGDLHHMCNSIRDDSVCNL
eukprot:jgi/Botrbrau1/17121/Bobra.0157s0022.1